MYTIDTSHFFSFFASLWGLVQGAMLLDPAAFQTVQVTKNAGVLSFVVIFLAGVSQTLGQCVTLLVNRVTPRRFLASVLVAGVIFALGAIVWMSSIWLIGKYVFHNSVPFVQVARTVGLAYAPLLLSFFVLLPYFGTFLNHLFDVWLFLAVLTAVHVTLSLSLVQSLWCALLGWVVIEVLKLLVGKPLTRLLNAMMSGVAGVTLSIRPQDLAKLLNETTDSSEGGKR